MHKIRIRTNDIKYNIEAGFYAAMSMLDKRIEFNYIPMTSMRINNIPIFFVGERPQGFHEIIVEGDISSEKFILYYVYGNEIVGFATVGY